MKKRRFKKIVKKFHKPSVKTPNALFSKRIRCNKLVFFAIVSDYILWAECKRVVGHGINDGVLFEIKRDILKMK